MQTEFLPQKDLRSIKAFSHGGTSLKKRRKVQRPLFPNKVIHVVFKSSKARGEMSFYNHKQFISALLKSKSRKFFIEIKDWVNMGNHLHLKVICKDTHKMGQFLKSVSSLIARHITKARKGHRFGKFWDGLVYTRIILTKFEELGLRGYFEANHREREYGYSEREAYRKRFNQFLYRLKKTKAREGPLKKLARKIIKEHDQAQMQMILT